jgi:hypothetical protein
VRGVHAKNTPGVYTISFMLPITFNIVEHVIFGIIYFRGQTRQFSCVDHKQNTFYSKHTHYHGTHTHTLALGPTDSRVAIFIG